MEATNERVVFWIMVMCIHSEAIGVDIPDCETHLYMSRNKEKNQSTLHRYYAQQEREAGVLESNPLLRPKYVQKVESLPQAERWRQTVMTEISVKLTDISDPSLNLGEIRSLNDELNKLHREKRAWEHHIKSLGGNDYIKYSKSQGIYVDGVRYYGRARELPEVLKKELLPEKTEKPYAPLDYYGSFQFGEPIVADKQYIQGQINGALGKQIYPVEAVALENDPDFPTNEDVKRMLLERQKAILRAQLGA